MKEVLRAGRLRPATWINVPTRRPFLEFTQVTEMARKHPVRPLVDQFRESALGTEMINLTSINLFAVGAQAEKSAT